MPALNPEAIPDDVREILDRLIAENTDPFELAVAAWNASWNDTQGAKHVPGDV